MSKLSRYTQLLFGSSASVNQMAEFGSFAEGSPDLYSGSSINPTIVQTLSNYLEGWYGAIVGENSPAIQDMNALCYLFAYQLCYLMQEGIAEWDAATTYFIGSLINSAGAVYASQSDSNLNNAVGTSSWGPPILPGAFLTSTQPANLTVPTGDSLFQPFLTINTGVTLTVSTGAYLVSVQTIIISGTGNLTLNGTAIGKVI